jgi:hypothetical protein
VLVFERRQARFLVGALCARRSALEQLMRALTGEDDPLELVLDFSHLVSGPVEKC